MIKNSISVNFLLYTCFLVIGYSASALIYHSDYGNTILPANISMYAVSKSSTTLENGQYIILLISIDSFEIPDVQLTGLWLVTYLPTTPTLNLLPIFPSGDDAFSEQESILYRAFSLDRLDGDVVLGKRFTDALADNNYWWSGYVIIDEIALSQLVSYPGETSDNYGLITQDFPKVIDDPNKYYTIQLALLQATCQKLSNLTNDTDWSTLISLIPDHIRTDIDVRQFSGEWAACLSNAHHLSCKFPTLQGSAVNY